MLPKEIARLEIYHLDSHRLAFFLDKDDKLVPLIQCALKKVHLSLLPQTVTSRHVTMRQTIASRCRLFEWA